MPALPSVLGRFPARDRALALEWAADNIRVNAVAAGMIATPLAKANWAKTGFDAAAATTAFPLRRPGENAAAQHPAPGQLHWSPPCGPAAR